MKKYIVILVILVANCYFLLSSSNVSAIDKKNHDEITQVILSDLRDDLSIINHIEQIGISDEDLNQIIVNSIIRKTLLLRVISPDANDLRGRSLETFCLLNEESNKHWIASADDKDLAELAINYIESTEQIIRARVAKLQETLLGTGCYLTPE